MKHKRTMVIFLFLLVFVGEKELVRKEIIKSSHAHSIDQSDGQVLTSFDNSATTNWKTRLVNYDHKLDRDYRPKLKKIDKNHMVDERVYIDLMKMMEDAEKEGLNLIICSSYRDYDRQEALHENKIKRCMEDGLSKDEAIKEARLWVAEAGSSEHQLGLALDIVSKDYQELDEKQEDTEEQKWLMKNSYMYGFILRYPNDKSRITKIGYEPWHYRYVGRDLASYLTKNKLTLEEYMEEKSEL